MGKHHVKHVAACVFETRRKPRKYNGRLAYIRSTQNPLDGDDIDVPPNMLRIRKYSRRRRCGRRYKRHIPNYLWKTLLEPIPNNSQTHFLSLMEFQQFLKKYKVSAGTAQRYFLEYLYRLITFYTFSSSRVANSNQRMFGTNWSCDPRVELQGSLIKHLCIQNIRKDWIGTKAPADHNKLAMFGKGAHRDYLRITNKSTQVIDT